MQRSKCLFLETTRDKFKRYIQQIHNDTENLLHLCIACYSSSALNCTTTTHTFYPRPSKYTPSHTQTCAYFHEFGTKKENTVQSQFNDTFGLRKRLSLN